MIKRLLCAFLAACLLVFSLAACTKSGVTQQFGFDPDNPPSSSLSSSTTSMPPTSSSTSSQQSSSIVLPSDPVQNETHRALAEQFVTALCSHDIATLNELTGANEGIYNQLENVTFTNVVLGVKSESSDPNLDSEYTLSFHTNEGQTILPTGDYSYQFSVAQIPYTDKIGITNFESTAQQNPDNLPYQNEAAAIASLYIGFYGTTEFASPGALSSHDILEFALIYMMNFSPETETSVENVHKVIAQLFGLTDFDGRDSVMYDESTDSYVILGRGGVSMNYHISQSYIDPSSGQYIVVASFFNDPLQLFAQSQMRFTFQKNEDGTFRILSGIKQ